jgi:glycosyltransferase involved in cell wall biosynthesis
VSRVLAVTLEQLYRPSPGGIATYVRGLVTGLAELDGDLEAVGLVPRGPAPDRVRDLALRTVSTGLPVAALTRVWATWAVGVPGEAAIVHATTLAGPYAGGAPGARHSVALHDLLWRDEPASSTRAGVRFHESRLRALVRRGDVMVVTTSPLLEARLVAEGVDAARVVPVRLGVDLDAPAASSDVVRTLLSARGVTGPFTLYAGTREPRKNLPALIAAHRGARERCGDLGPLVLAGPAGWGGVDTGDAVVLGVVDAPVLRALYRDAALVAYVPLAEGWGLPPIEALAAGARVVASSSTPSVAANPEVELVVASDADAIAQGLVRALERPADEAARAARRASVATLTWRQCALDHLAAWR